MFCFYEEMISNLGYLKGVYDVFLNRLKGFKIKIGVVRFLIILLGLLLDCVYYG